MHDTIVHLSAHLYIIIAPTKMEFVLGLFQFPIYFLSRHLQRTFMLTEWNCLIKERCNKARQGKYNTMKQIGTEHVSSQIDRDNSSPHLAASTHHPVGGRHLAKLLKKGKPWWGEEGWWRWRDNWRGGWARTMWERLGGWGVGHSWEAPQRKKMWNR